ncbi:MAG: gliding motility protein GldM [Flavobacteriales bacterium]|jgi:gliding motility-associated protein GldM|nr:gliding motility protein GldM [Flavobacteriales bacterium]
MASGKLSPRQKMINMMYLVLTALLALNVSKDILHAFAKVEDGFATTVSAMESNNTELYKSFAALAEKKVSAKENQVIAEEVRSRAKQLNDHIQTLHKDITNLNGEPELDEDLGMKLPEKMDDLDKVANLLLKKPKRAEKLRIEIEKYRDYLLGLSEVTKNPSIRADIERAFNTKDRKVGAVNLKWEDATFGHYPLIAILTFLRKIQADVVKVESDVVGSLYSSVGKSAFSFDELEAMIVPKSSSLLAGDKYEADVFVTAFDSKQKPKVEFTRKFSNGKPNFDGSSDLPVENGKGKLSFVASGVGEHKIGAKITIVKTDGTSQSWETQNAYNVASPTAVVSPTKMNVFYQGVPNPIEVSVPGVDSRNVRISVSGAAQKNAGKGKYDITVAKGNSKNVNISVTANGKRIGKPKEFRVKRIPNPVSSVAGLSEGRIAKGLLLSTKGVRAKLRDFPFDINFRVKSYTLRIKEGEYIKEVSVKGDLFTPAIKEKLRRVKPGSDVSFVRIRAKAKAYPSIPTKVCPPVVLTVN